MSEQAENLVSLSIDGHDVSVPRGTTIIEAAKKVQTEIPHYCYHPDLSIAGNCRICQVEVEGAPKLMIACHTQVQPDMKVKTHLTSEKVKHAQASTLELILINHPLDCTICDQSGHCKLQDYHFEYNGGESRFIEEKETKVKAEPLGPNVMLDGERCIMCTRCIRFCDEVTGTSELGMANRGDKSVITINPGKELDNPLAASVVDLCPVGALTHRNWRFNTRIWYTNQVDTICTGCSTGCNVKLATRDNQVVHVKARHNQAVNKEWMCDEGRYGFDRFIAENQLTSAQSGGKDADLQTVLKQIKKPTAEDKVLFFLAPDLMLEDYFLIKKFISDFELNARVAVAHRSRELTEVEAILISPDYSANIKGAEYLGLVANPEETYEHALAALTEEDLKSAFFIGDRSILDQDLSSVLLESIAQKEQTVFIGTDKQSKIAANSKIVLPARGVYQKSGTMINSKSIIQYLERALEFPAGTHPEWRMLKMIAKGFGKDLTGAIDDRSMTLELLKELNKPEIINIAALKNSESAVVLS